MLLQIPDVGFAEAPVTVDGADTVSVVWMFMGLLGTGARKRVLKSKFGGHKCARKSSVSSLGKRRDWVLQVAGILGICGRWKGSLRAQHAAWEKRIKNPHRKNPPWARDGSVFNLFHLSHS